MPERTLRTYQLRRVLERLRKAAGLTLTEASAATDGDVAVSSLSRYESGASVPNALIVRALLTAYGVSGTQMDGLLRLAREAQQRSAWHPYTEVLPTWFHFFADLEQAASSIRTFEASLIPGIFQTSCYARALLSLAPSPPDAAEIDRLLEARMLRTEALTREDSPPQVEAVVTEGALRRIVADKDVQHEQLAHLVELLARPNVSIHVLPAATPHPGDRSFVLLHLPEPENLELAYEEYVDGALYPDAPNEVAKYSELYSHLRERALPDRESKTFIRRLEP